MSSVKALELQKLMNVAKVQRQVKLELPKAPVQTIKLNSEEVLGKKDVNTDKPLVFLHGLFGSTSTFKNYA